MKVCHFISTTMHGAYFRNLIGGLVEKGVVPVCVELGAYNPPQWLSEVPTVKYYNLGVSSKYYYALAIARLAGLLRRERVDILQTHLYDAGLIGVIAGRLARTPVVALTRHHTSVVKMLGKGYHIALDRWMADSADQVVVVSDAVRRFMKESDRVKGDHITVINIGFDFDKLTASDEDRRRVRAEFGFSASDFVVGYVGQFTKGKGHPQLAKAVGLLRREIPEIQLLFVGKGSRDETDAIVNEFDLGDKTVYAGWRDDIAACIRAMDVFVQPSLSEAFSQVLIEAMAVGTPTVATDVGGAAEVIVNRENALLIAPDDPRAIADSVLELYRQLDFRQALAATAYADVRKRFTIERMVERQAECYSQWLSLKKRLGGTSKTATDKIL